MADTVGDEILLYLRARVGLLVLVTVEEERALALLAELTDKRGGELVSWDVADSFTGGGALPDTADPARALDLIRDRTAAEPDRRDLYVLKDLAAFWSDPGVRRRLRTLAQRLVRTGSSLVVLAPTRDVPVELRDEAVLVDLPLPTEGALRDELDRLTAGIRTELTEAGRARLARAALGLTAAQARRAFAKAIVRDDTLDDRAVEAVVREKRAAIRESRALEFFPYEDTPAEVGGLDALKGWLLLRERAFGPEAAAYGLPAPKGLALIGIPGTGKSLTAKLIGGLWRLPLLRLDVGALFGSLVGESEERVRRALELAGTVAPCVLWIDELEKGFGSGDRDGGTSQRVFGTVLTWMQEKTAPVFVVATANDVSRLPVETLRRGRFDEVFFLDLPTEPERREILAVHLRKRRRDPARFDLRRLAAAAAGYTGAELEQAVIDAMYRAFAEDRDVDTGDVAAAVAGMVPLSRAQREVIDRLRGWLHEGRAQSASLPAAAAEPVPRP